MEEMICRVIDVRKGERTTDGAGVSLYRIMPSKDLDHVDPFVLLDEFRSEDPDDYKAGFPMHPHRGIETVTYMLEGKFTHRDSKGNQGEIGPGGVQWMTAGRGILHEEMPAMEEGKLWGYQLWLSLPAKDKMIQPRYQNLESGEIPVVEGEGSRVRVISGVYQGTLGPAVNHVPSIYLDIRLNRDSIVEHNFDPKINSFIYVHSGEVVVGDDWVVHEGEAATLGECGYLKVRGRSETCGLLFLAGKANNESIVRGGPFVMNTRDEVHKAFEDHRNGVLHI